MNNSVTIVFPHQLYHQHPAIHNGQTVVMVEESLYFNQFRFNKQKLVLHRASMQFYHAHLKTRSVAVKYIEAREKHSDIRRLIPHLAQQGVTEVHYAEINDDWLERRMIAAARKHNIHLVRYDSPNFLNTVDEVRNFFSSRKTYFQADFYAWQRKKQQLLLTPEGGPLRGKWSFDADNRKKIPKGETLPIIDMPAENEFVAEARSYVEKHYRSNYGSTEPLLQNGRCFYPTTFGEAEQWLHNFLHHRFYKFGVYEDAMVKNERFLFHGVLTPALNVGLLTPKQIIDAALNTAETQAIPYNSVEGFIRQVTGWREYIRSVYMLEGRNQRTKHFWGFNRKIPETFWTGNTGIVPVDTVIKRVLQNGYTHHIERLMVMGNFMLLCEFDPDHVYRWFMEMYVDAYDWVMVPNVYGMTQFADGGLMMTKPYISSSNYIMKMSDYAKGEWQQVWDGLFWRFMHVHRDVVAANQRLGMLINTFDKMPDEKKKAHIDHAEKFLRTLDDNKEAAY